MAEPGRVAAGDGAALTRELGESPERCRDLEQQLVAARFECDRYYVEWLQARNQLDEIHRSKMWRLWMSSIAMRRTARRPFSLVAAWASGIAGCLRWCIRWVAGAARKAPRALRRDGKGSSATSHATVELDTAVDAFETLGARGLVREQNPLVAASCELYCTDFVGLGLNGASQADARHDEAEDRIAMVKTRVLDLLMSARPTLHYDEHNQPVSWGIDADVLRELDRTIERGSRTLETGAGLTTILFAAKGCHHTVICPDEREFRNIATFCGKNGISLDTVEMVTERSELYLPRVVGLDLDAAVIDGRHGFPSPFIDWFYIAWNLRIGGVLVIDDTPIFTGRILDEFLSEDPHWELMRRFPRTSFFSKRTTIDHQEEWNNQPYVRRLSS